MNGHAEVVVTDAEKRGGAASTLTYKAKITNTNVEKNTGNYEGQLSLKLKDGKNLENTFTLKNAPEGDKLKFDFKVCLFFFSHLYDLIQNSYHR